MGRDRIMNDIELQNIESMFGTTKNKTMANYFEELNAIIGVDIDILESEFKGHYPEESNWSF